MRYNTDMISKKTHTKHGLATLPTVIILSAMALVVVVGITTVSLTESFISQGATQSAKALLYAEGGARDALTKIARKKDYTCSSSDCYTIDFVSGGCAGALDGCAKVSVSAAAGTTAAPKIITSKGVVKDNTRTLQVSVVLDSGTAADGKITSTSWSEVTN